MCAIQYIESMCKCMFIDIILNDWLQSDTIAFTLKDILGITL